MSVLSWLDVDFRYGKRRPLLCHFSLVVPAGVTVLLGPNGAGKSTLMALAAGALRPRRGSVRQGTLDATKRTDRHDYLAAVGWVPQMIAPIPSFRVREQVAYAAWLKGLSRSEAWDAAGDALDVAGLSDLGSRRVSELSGGELRRVGIAEALAHRCTVVLLDEPTAGLDVTARRMLRDTTRRLAESGTSSVIATHQTEDLHDLADHVVVLCDASVRFSGSPSELLRFAEPGAPYPIESAYETLVAG